MQPAASTQFASPPIKSCATFPRSPTDSPALCPPATLPLLSKVFLLLLTSHYCLQEDIHVDDFITSYLLKTCLMKLLPRHSQAEGCNCDDRPTSIWTGEQTTGCRWTAVEGDIAGCWAIRIYQKLETDLKTKQIGTWCNYNTRLMSCSGCKVERGCWKKMKLTLAMTSQILSWFKQHHAVLTEICEFQLRS